MTLSTKALPALYIEWKLAPFFLILCAVLTSAGCNSKPDWTFATPWTVEIVGRELTYTLRAPFGTFMIFRESDVDFDNHRVSGLSFISMHWNYDSGEPLWLWLSNNGKQLDDTSDTRISTKVNVVSADIDIAKISRNTYFGQYLTNREPSIVPKLQGLIWDDSVSKYKDYDTTYYVIEKREPFDGSVIVCRDSAHYCRLYGATLTETLEVGSIMVLKEDVENWKQYQHMVQERVGQAIVDVRPTEESKPSRWFFWR